MIASIVPRAREGGLEGYVIKHPTLYDPGAMFLSVAFGRW